MHDHKMNKIYYTKFNRSICAYCIAGVLCYLWDFFFGSKRLVSAEKAGAISESFAEQFFSIYVGQTLEQASSNFVCFWN